MAAEADFLGLLELLVCVPHEGATMLSKYTDPLGKICAMSNHADANGRVSQAFFFPTYRADASPVCPKWVRLPDRLGVKPEAIQNAMTGVGVISNRRLLPLFGKPPFAPAKVAPVCGYLGTGNTIYSPLVYFGGRDSEQRVAIFCRFPLGPSSLLVCLTHLTTVHGERQLPRDPVAETIGQQIRSFQCSELVQAVQQCQEWASQHHGQTQAVIMGDFNCSPNAVEMSIFRQAGLRSIYESVGYANLPTKRPSNLCTDHAWITHGLSVGYLRTQTVGASDHDALTLQITSRITRESRNKEGERDDE